MKPVMKKRILIAGLAVTLVIVNANVAVFAETKPMESKYMSVQELKSAIAEKELDGVLSEAEQKSIFDNATEEAVNDFISVKMDEALDVLQEQNPQLQKGEESGWYHYDLGEGCTLEVELEDKAEAGQEKSLLMPMVTSGTSSVWKEYGDRYFTAKATVVCGRTNVTFLLENHYTLSAGGIEERYGKKAINFTELVNYSMGNPRILKSSAKTVGSLVEIVCAYSCGVDQGKMNNYELSSTVKYLTHDKVGKRLQVQQAWNLTKK